MSLMHLQEKQVSELSKLVDTISLVHGVVAIILFGSVARNEHDEHSDYDLLVVFNDSESMWNEWETLFSRVGELRLSVHVIPKSLEEFREKMETSFLREILTYGRILYMRFPFQASCLSAEVKQVAIVMYSLSGLKQKEKMRLLYELYGRRKQGREGGLLNRIGGRRLTDSCVLVPREGLGKVLSIFKKYELRPFVLEAYLPPLAS